MFRKEKPPKRFEIVEADNLRFGLEARVLADTETGVQYLFVDYGYAGGLTVLVDQDGKPLIDINYQKNEEVKQ